MQGTLKQPHLILAYKYVSNWEKKTREFFGLSPVHSYSGKIKYWKWPVIRLLEFVRYGNHVYDDSG
jgi:hypothetical protein